MVVTTARPGMLVLVVLMCLADDALAICDAILTLCSVSASGGLLCLLGRTVFAGILLGWEVASVNGRDCAVAPSLCSMRVSTTQSRLPFGGIFRVNWGWKVHPQLCLPPQTHFPCFVILSVYSRTFPSRTFHQSFFCSFHQSYFPC